MDALFSHPNGANKKSIESDLYSKFGIEILDTSLEETLNLLVREKDVELSAEGKYTLSDLKRMELIKATSEAEQQRALALDKWLSNTVLFEEELSLELTEALKEAIDPFLDEIFVRHGVSSYKLIGMTTETPPFDIDEIAEKISQNYDTLQVDVKEKLKTIFRLGNEIEIVNYMNLKIENAISYLCTVMPQEVYRDVKSRLSGVVIYLDTSVIYRLLDLQGEHRFNTTKKLIDLCLSGGANLKISAETYGELKRRIEYDAKVLKKYPTKTNLIRLGYNYKSEDNYVSAYWKRTLLTGVSVDDFNNYYLHADTILTKDYQIEIESMNVDTELLNSLKETMLTKIHQFDREKNVYASSHDAYCLAHVRLQQDRTASNGIDSKALFLTTDQSLIQMQSSDYELKKALPLAATPSQLMQIFSFITSLGEYTETFVNFFSSSSIPQGNNHSTEQIHEILGRMSHYEYGSNEVAEEVLTKQLLSDSFWNAESDSEKEEMIYNAISEELVHAIEKAKEENKGLAGENEALNEAVRKNEATFSEYQNRFEGQDKRLKQQGQAIKAKDREIRERTQTIEGQNQKLEKIKYNYIMKKWKTWRIKRISYVVAGVVLALLCAWLLIRTFRTAGFNLGDSSTIIERVLSIVFVSIAIPLIKAGLKIFQPAIKTEIQKRYGEEFDSDMSTL